MTKILARFMPLVLIPSLLALLPTKMMRMLILLLFSAFFAGVIYLEKSTDYTLGWVNQVKISNSTNVASDNQQYLLAITTLLNNEKVAIITHETAPNIGNWVFIKGKSVDLHNQKATFNLITASHYNQLNSGSFLSTVQHHTHLLIAQTEKVYVFLSLGILLIVLSFFFLRLAFVALTGFMATGLIFAAMSFFRAEGELVLSNFLVNAVCLSALVIGIIQGWRISSTRTFISQNVSALLITYLLILFYEPFANTYFAYLVVPLVLFLPASVMGIVGGLLISHAFNLSTPFDVLTTAGCLVISCLIYSWMSKKTTIQTFANELNTNEKGFFSIDDLIPNRGEQS